MNNCIDFTMDETVEFLRKNDKSKIRVKSAEKRCNSLIKFRLTDALSPMGRGQISFVGLQTQSPPWSFAHACRNEKNGNLVIWQKDEKQYQTMTKDSEEQTSLAG